MMGPPGMLVGRDQGSPCGGSSRPPSAAKENLSQLAIALTNSGSRIGVRPSPLSGRAPRLSPLRSEVTHRTPMSCPAAQLLTLARTESSHPVSSTGRGHTSVPQTLHRQLRRAGYEVPATPVLTIARVWEGVRNLQHPDLPEPARAGRLITVEAHDLRCCESAPIRPDVMCVPRRQTRVGAHRRGRREPAP